MATKKSNQTYQLHLKGFVGGYDFDADYVDYILSKNEGTEVHVLIDSLGGKSNTALSIFSAFKRHGNVNVHFVGMNASAATIASLGARHITMDASAMYLVHKCSIGFFEWGNMNADDLQTLIGHIEAQKKDLDKLDANIAQMYATRCKKSPNDLLALMKEGGWLTAKEALDWGFVDELTDYEDETAPVLTDTLAYAMANAGIPVPAMPKTTAEQSAIVRFFNSLAAFFTGTQRSQPGSENSLFAGSDQAVHGERSGISLNNDTDNHQSNDHIMNKMCTRVCAILSCDHLESQEGRVTLTDGQLDCIEAAVNADKQTIQSLKGQVQTLTAEKQALADTNAQLQAQVDELQKKPADSSSQIVSDAKSTHPDTTGMQSFFNTRSNARKLYDLMP